MRCFYALAVLASAAFAAVHPDLNQVKSVYLLPMSNGLDQYLATKLTEKGVFQVVTDPKKADAIFTDKIGEGFEQRLEELYPPPPEPKPPEHATDAKADTNANAKPPDDLWNKPVQHVGGFSKGRGTLFLVDRHTRNVLWSTYQPVNGSEPDDVNHRADQITHRLIKDRKVK
jgi:hypothetical protein